MKIFDAALSASWAMEETALYALLEIAAREHTVTPEALDAYRSKQLANAERAKERNGVAIISAEGPMFKKANLLTEMSGATSYEILRRDFQAALDSPDVHSILLNIDSPGGEAAGTGELAQAIYEARGKKPIVAYAADLAASAGYWLASAADKIVIGASAQLGSIGVRAAMTDTSARDAARGVKSIEFVSSQSPYKAADIKTEDGRARVQSRIDALAQVFIEAVAQNRGVSVAHVLDSFGKGDVFVGKAAIAAGMADEFGTFEGVLASLVERRGANAGFARGFMAHGQTEEVTMLTEEQKAAAEAAAAAEAEAKAKADAEAQAAAAEAEAAANAGENDPVAAAVAAERTRVADIFAMALEGYEAMRDEAIKSGSSAHEFAAKIVAAEKAKSRARAEAVDEDVRRNAEVSPSTGTEAATGDDAAVKAILSAGAHARGEK